MKPKIKITLLPGWMDVSRDYPDSPPTYLRGSGKCPLQVSLIKYKSGDIPNPSEQDLEKLSRGFGIGTENSLGEVIETFSGDCRLGKFGTTVYRSQDFPRAQLWYLSNGKDFIIVTHICPEEPDPQELIEVDQIIRMLEIVRKNNLWWKFW